MRRGESTESVRSPGACSQLSPPPGSGRRQRRTYSPPHLTDYGSLLELTLGGPYGSGDSGPGLFTQDPLP